MTWQVTLPAPLMSSLELELEDWVYVSSGRDGRSLRVTPAATKDVTLQAERPSIRPGVPAGTPGGQDVGRLSRPPRRGTTGK